MCVGLFVCVCVRARVQAGGGGVCWGSEEAFKKSPNCRSSPLPGRHTFLWAKTFQPHHTQETQR